MIQSILSYPPQTLLHIFPARLNSKITLRLHLLLLLNPCRNCPKHRNHPDDKYNHKADDHKKRNLTVFHCAGLPQYLNSIVLTLSPMGQKKEAASVMDDIEEHMKDPAYVKELYEF